MSGAGRTAAVVHITAVLELIRATTEHAYCAADLERMDRAALEALESYASMRSELEEHTSELRCFWCGEAGHFDHSPCPHCGELEPTELVTDHCPQCGEQDIDLRARCPRCGSC